MMSVAVHEDGRHVERNGGRSKFHVQIRLIYSMSANVASECNSLSHRIRLRCERSRVAAGGPNPSGRKNGGHRAPVIESQFRYFSVRAANGVRANIDL